MQPEKPHTVQVTVLPEEPREPEEVWVDFFYAGKHSLGNGGWRVFPKNAQE